MTVEQAIELLNAHDTLIVKGKNEVYRTLSADQAKAIAIFLEQYQIALREERQQLTAMTAKAELYERALRLAAKEISVQDGYDVCPAEYGYDCNNENCKADKDVTIPVVYACWESCWLKQAEQANDAEVADNG